MIAAYPLQWPVGRARWGKQRQSSAFKMGDGAMKEHLFTELERMRASDIVVSTNQTSYSRGNFIDDPGVAVYFTRKGQELCIACDKYLKVVDNLHAIGMAVEAFRMLERHGTGEMVDAAFSGFKALPESVIVTPYTARPWYDVLQVSPDASPEVIRAAYKSLLHQHHPDKGGDPVLFEQLQKAKEEAGI